MNEARLRFSTEIVRRLGEELNPSLEKGVLELVKNAYDADATECRVELLNTNGTGGTVTVTDNGDGMTVDDIVDGWLVLGKSTKTQQQRTRLGRIPAGSKGLGRLAALRMGKRALMTTRPRGEKGSEHGLLLDWDEFDTADLVDDVELTAETSYREHRTASGTEIRIEELRTGFGRMSVKKLARELVLLADPFGDDPAGFRPELAVAEYADLETLVRGRYFRDAEYHLRAEVDARGLASARVKDWRGEDLFAADHSAIAVHGGRERYGSPAARFDLWVFIFESRYVLHAKFNRSGRSKLAQGIRRRPRLLQRSAREPIRRSGRRLAGDEPAAGPEPGRETRDQHLHRPSRRYGPGRGARTEDRPFRVH